MGSAGVILKTAASRTPSATAAEVVKNARLRVIRTLGLTGGGPVTINAGMRGAYGRVFLKKRDGSGYRLTHHEGFLPLNRHYSDDEWAVISSAIESVKKVVPRAVQEGRLSAGLARGSWVLIADSLGIALESVTGGGSISAGAIAKARESRAKGGVQRNNGASRIESDKGKFFVTLINRLPYGRRIGLDRMLAAVVNGHAQRFFTSVKKGFDGSLAQTFQQFPGWTVRTR